MHHPAPLIFFLMDKKLNELIKYGVVGVINTAMGYGVFWIFFRWLNFSPEAANAIGYVSALSLAFILNHIFVFSGSTISATSAARFVAAFSIAFLINQIVLLVLFRIFSVPPEVAQIFAMIVYTVVFYLINKNFVFHKRIERDR